MLALLCIKENSEEEEEESAASGKRANMESRFRKASECGKYVFSSSIMQAHYCGILIVRFVKVGQISGHIVGFWT